MYRDSSGDPTVAAMANLRISAKKAPSGETTEFDLPRTVTVGEVALKVAQSEGCEASRVVMIYKGAVMKLTDQVTEATGAAGNSVVLVYMIQARRHIQISVKTLSATAPIPILTDPNGTIRTLRQQIMSALPPECAHHTVRILSHGVVVTNDERTLSAVGIADGDSVIALTDAGCVPAPRDDVLADQHTIEQVMQQHTNLEPNTAEMNMAALLAAGGPIARDIVNDEDVQSALSNHHVLNVFKAMLEAPETAHLALCDPHVGPLLRRLSAIANNNGL